MAQRTLDFVIYNDEDLMYFLDVMSQLIFQAKRGDQGSRQDIFRPAVSKQTFNTPIDLYKMLRIKMKISYHACQSRVSIIEHFLNAMMKTYQDRYLDKGFINLSQTDTDGITQQLQQLMLIQIAFKPKLKGLAQLQVIRGRLHYQRLKFETFIKNEWDLGDSFCARVPRDMQIVTYPQSFRFYDCVPLIIAKYIAGKIYRMRLYQE